MNERSDFDELLRSRLEGMSEPAPDVWEGIVKGLERHRRAVIFRRFSVGVAAAAAVLAIAWLVFRGPQAGEPLQVPVQTAQQVDVTTPGPVTDETPEIAPIAEQVAAFTRNQSVARAEKVDKPSTPATAVPVSDQTGEPVEPKTEPQPVVATDPAVNPADTPSVEPNILGR